MKTAVLLATCLLSHVAGGALTSTSDHQVKKPAPNSAAHSDHRVPGVSSDNGFISGANGEGDRMDGDTLAEAWVIGLLPFTGFGNTCNYVDHYDEICPYSGSTSGDVVYAYSPGSDQTIDLDLCYSQFDTKIFVYEDGLTSGEPYACNDDFHYGAPCHTYASKIELLSVYAGHTYYFVVDGYGGACGNYQISVTLGEPCTLECSGDALHEGEPGCQDGYLDEYNSGCGGGEWMIIERQSNNCASLCGESCTYEYLGSNYRDTDWFEVLALGGVLTATCTADFPVQLLLIYNTDCNNLQYHMLQGDPCETLTLSRIAEQGEVLWVWVGPSIYSDVHNGEYVLEVCGIDGPSPAQKVTWGALKSRFR